MVASANSGSGASIEIIATRDLPYYYLVESTQIADISRTGESAPPGYLELVAAPLRQVSSGIHRHQKMKQKNPGVRVLTGFIRNRGRNRAFCKSR